MSVTLSLLGFKYCCQWRTIFIKKKTIKKITQAAQDEIEIGPRFWLRDDAGEGSLQFGGSRLQLCDHVDEIIKDKDIAIVVELMGHRVSEKPYHPCSWKWVHVVSANKDLLAVHGSELLEIA